MSAGTRSALRKTCIKARDSLGEATRERLSRLVAERIMASPQFQRAETVLIYRAVQGEVCLDALRAAGKRLAYPLCVSGTEMVALLPGGDDAWAVGRYGIMEPIREKSRLIPPTEIDMVLCPCTAFDEGGTRMGMGAGYYDRYLPQCSRAFIAAAAFECQKADIVPPEPWDVSMQMIFTELNTYTAT